MWILFENIGIRLEDSLDWNVGLNSEEFNEVFWWRNHNFLDENSQIHCRSIEFSMIGPKNTIFTFRFSTKNHNFHPFFVKITIFTYRRIFSKENNFQISQDKKWSEKCSKWRIFLKRIFLNFQKNVQKNPKITKKQKMFKKTKKNLPFTIRFLPFPLVQRTKQRVSFSTKHSQHFSRFPSTFRHFQNTARNHVQ